MADNNEFAAVLEIPQTVLDRLDSFDRKLAKMDKSLSSIVNTMKGKSLGDLLEVKVNTKDAEESIARVATKLNELKSPKEIKVELQDKDALQKLAGIVTLLSAVSNFKADLGASIKTASDAAVNAEREKERAVKRTNKAREESAELLEKERLKAEILAKRTATTNLVGKGSSEAELSMFRSLARTRLEQFKRLNEELVVLQKRYTDSAREAEVFAKAMEHAHPKTRAMGQSGFARATEEMRVYAERLAEVRQLLSSMPDMYKMTDRFVSTPSPVKTYRTMAEELKAEVGKNSIFNFETDSIDQVEERLRRLKELVKEMKAAMKSNPFISPEDIKVAEAGVKRLTDGIRELKIAKARAREDSLLKKGERAIAGIDPVAIQACRDKLVALQQQIQMVKKATYITEGDRQNMLMNLQRQSDEVNKKLLLFQRVAGNVSNDAMMLKSRFNMMFGIMGINQFVKNVVKIRGEFEMIQKSLEVLVGDATLSRDIFKQIQDIAIESPYEIKDLARQTKQLAAYGIETEKLVEKTKMLGDIAAGTGVEINRLALAYGQIRAAQFLKGTEARQLTEAGVDIYSALSKYYSDLEGRMVSVSEIMDRQRKKLITFEDVDKVLQGMTNIGGKFYQMQEKQAQTIQGQLSNLKDRSSKMFNEIGTDFEKPIKSIIKLMNFILSNSGLVETAVMGWAGYRVINMSAISFGHLNEQIYKTWRNGGQLSKVLSNGAGGFNQFGKAIMGLSVKLGAMSGWLGAAAAAIAVIAVAIRKAREETRLLNKVEEESRDKLNEEIRGYTALNDVLVSDTATRREKEKALEDMKTQYGNILPLQKYELDNINDLTDAYNSNISALRQYIKEKASLEAKRTLIENADDKFDASRAASKMTEALNREFEQINKVRIAKGEQAIEWSQGQVAAAMESVFNSAIEGEIENGAAGMDRFVALLLQVKNLSPDLKEAVTGAFARSASNQWEKLYKAVARYTGIAEKVAGFNERIDVTPGMQDSIDKMKEVTKAYDDFVAEHKNDEQYKHNTALLKQDAEKAAQEAYDSIMSAFEEQVAEGAFENAGEAYAENFRNSMERGFENLKVSGLEKAMRNFFAETNKALQQNVPGLNVDFGSSHGTDMKDGETPTEYRKRLLKDMAENKKVIDKIKSGSYTEVDWEEMVDQLLMRDFWNSLIAGVDDLSPDKAEALMRDAQATFLRVATGFVTTVEDKTKTIGTSGKDELQEQVRAAKEYKKNVAAFVKELRDTVKAWGDLDSVGRELQKRILSLKGKELNLTLPDIASLSDVDSYITSLMDGGKLTEQDKLEIELLIHTEQSKKNLDSLKDSVNELWEQYDFLKEMEDLNIHVDAKSALDILAELGQKEQDLLSMNTDGAAEAAKDIAEKRLKILRDERKQALKLMAESEKKAADESVKAYEEAFKNVNFILANANNAAAFDGKTGGPATSEQIQAAINGEMAKAAEKTAKAQWDAYKSTEMYIASFGDLDQLGTSVIETLKAKLEDYQRTAKEALSPTEMKQISTTILDMEDELRSRVGSNSFMGVLFNGVKQIREARKTYAADVSEAFEVWTRDMQNLANAQAFQADTLRDLKDAQAKLAEVEAKRTSETQAGGVSDETEREYSAQREEVARAEERHKAAILAVDAATQQADASTRQYTRTTKSVQNAVKALQKNLGTIRDAYDKQAAAIMNVIDYTLQCGEAFGMALDEDQAEVLDSFKDGFALVGGAITTLVACVDAYNAATTIAIGETMTLETLLWPLLLVAAALGAITAALKAADIAIARNIESHKENIERLSKEYKKLEDVIESAVNLNDVGQTYEKQLQNLEKQRSELQQIIRLEQSRKNPNEDDLKGYRDDLDELESQAKDARKKLDDILGKPSDYQSLAKSWASAWLDAFKETGDGLSSLQESFEDMFNDIIVGQLQNITVGPAAQQFKAMVDNVLSDMVITRDEAEQLTALKETLLRSVNEQNKSLMESLGIGQNGTLETDTIQKGLQSLTEDTGIALESLANSMRALLANMDANISRFLGDGSGEMENPFLVQMRAQTELTRDIKSLLTDVIKRGSHSAGGAAGIRVFTD